MTQIFVNRAELIPAGETTEDHHKWSQEEAKTVEKDKNTDGNYRGGLFRGCFGHSFRINGPPIRDAEDGVVRCPRCTWELEDGFCSSCDYQVIASAPGSPTISYFDEDEISDQYLAGEFRGHRLGSIDLGSELSSDQDADDALAIASERAAIRRRFRARGRDTAPPYNRYPAAPAVYSETDGLEDGDDFSVEDEVEDEGSLNDFIVNDRSERTQSRGQSPQSSHYDSGEGTDIINDFEGYSSDEEQEHGDENRSDIASRVDQSGAVIDLDSDSDEGPVVRNRRFGYPRFSLSSRLSSNDEDVAGVNPYSFSRRSSGQERGLTSDRRTSVSTRDTGNRRRGSGSSRDFAGLPIEINTDSDSLPLRRRRRAIQQQILSDEDGDDGDNGASSAAHESGAVSSRPSSSGTATVGRASPSQSSGTGRNLQPNTTTASFIQTNSGSSGLHDAHHNRYTYLAYGANSPSRSSELFTPRGPRAGTSPTRDTPSPAFQSAHHDRRPHSEANSSPEAVTRSPRRRRAPSFLDRSRPRTLLETRLEQLRSPRRQSATASSSRSHHTTSRQSASETYARMVRSRDARKIERQQAKQERRRRERELANNTSRSYRLPASPAESELTSMDSGMDYL